MLFTFYSYKGGVGRSMALANIGMLLFRRPLNVILVDWDLEAPGLEMYFNERYPELVWDAVVGRPGLCDLVKQYKETISRPPPADEPLPAPFPDLDDFLITLHEADGCTLQLLTAGDRTDWPRYASFVQTFNWTDFYENWSGGALVDWLHDELCDRADVVLVDSRTGITEIGGVTTHQLADAIVMLFAPNHENMLSSARMAAGFMDEATAKERGRPLPVICVPSRVDAQDSSEFGEFRTRLVGTIYPLVPDELIEGADLDEMTIPYAAAISFRERLLFGDAEMERKFPALCDAYGSVASNMQRLAPVGSWLARGSHVVARRRVMVIGGGARQAEVGKALVGHGFEVVGDEALAAGSNLAGSTADAASEMAGVLCVVALIDARTAHSRVFSRAVALADRHEKAIIPILLDPGVELPDELAHLFTMTWDGSDDAVHRLLAAVMLPHREVADVSPVVPSIFISYVHDDRVLVEQVAARLRSAGLEVGYDSTIVLPGDDWRRSLAEAVKRSDTVLAIVSPASVESGFWRNEVAMATDLRKRVIPVQTFDVDQAALPYALKQRQAVELNLMDKARFESGVQRLVGELRQPAAGSQLPPPGTWTRPT